MIRTEFRYTKHQVVRQNLVTLQTIRRIFSKPSIISMTNLRAYFNGNVSGRNTTHKPRIP